MTAERKRDASDLQCLAFIRELASRFGIRKAVLTKADAEEYFGVPYHNFIQGAIFHSKKSTRQRDFTVRYTLP